MSHAPRCARRDEARYAVVHAVHAGDDDVVLFCGARGAARHHAPGVLTAAARVMIAGAGATAAVSTLVRLMGVESGVRRVGGRACVSAGIDSFFGAGAAGAGFAEGTACGHPGCARRCDACTRK
jgi:hypothetical protein